MRTTTVKMMTALGLALGLSAGLCADPDGWMFYQGDADKPAILLIHGLAASKTHWTEPGATWSIKNAHFDHRAKVNDREGDKDGTTKLGVTVYPVLAGIESIRTSPKDDNAGEKGSFWAYLVGKGYTVATWNQVPCMDSADLPDQACKSKDTFAPAYATAKEAFAKLAELSGNAPIALVGHSRGGLIARALLKEEGLAGRDRVKWLITLHSPHQGSSMATMGVGLQDKLSALDGGLDLEFLPKDLRKAAKGLVSASGTGLNGTIDGLVAITGMDGARELAANGEVLGKLRKDEVKPKGVKVVTFGGNSPKVAELQLFLYDLGSASPKQKSWHADHHKILDFPNDLKAAFDEMKPGKGDLLVTDKNSRLPWEDQHITESLNHAEVLWNREVQDQVDAVITPPVLKSVVDSVKKPEHIGNTGVAGPKSTRER